MVEHIHYVQTPCDYDKVDVPWELVNGYTGYLEFIFKECSIELIDTIIKNHTYSTIWKATKNEETIYLKVTGVNHGYAGVTYEGYSFVTPKIKTICVYN